MIKNINALNKEIKNILGRGNTRNFIMNFIKKKLYLKNNILKNIL